MFGYRRLGFGSRANRAPVPILRAPLTSDLIDLIGNGTPTSTRASGATYNVAGVLIKVGSGVARLSAKGRFHEHYSRSNYCRTTENCTSTTGWPDASRATADQIAAPDGALTADLWTAANASFGGIVRNSHNSLPGSTPAISSCFVKKGTNRYVGLSLGNLGTSSAVCNFFDFDTETVNNTAVPGSPLQWEAWADGWYRIWAYYASANTEFFTDVFITNASGSTNYTPGGTETLYPWGIQTEVVSAGPTSRPSSYIPNLTGTSPAVRAGEVFTYAGNFDALSVDAAGAFYAIIDQDEDGDFAEDCSILSFSDTIGSGLGGSGANVTMNDGTTTATASHGGLVAGTELAVSGRWSTPLDELQAIAGATVGSAVSYDDAMPRNPADTLHVGLGFTGWFRELRVY